MYWHSTAHILDLSIVSSFSFFKFLHIRAFLFLIHVIVSLCSYPHDIWCSHMRILLLYLDTLTLDKQIVGVSWSFGHIGNLLSIFVSCKFGFFYHRLIFFGRNICSTFIRGRRIAIVNMS